MESLTIEQIKNVNFTLYPSNPLIKPFGASPIVADPSVLTPNNVKDNKWHMFLHNNFGVYHFISVDGIHFKKAKKLFGRAMRPNINFIGGTYYLFYEKTAPLITNALTLISLTKWKSEIYMSKSSDLINWSKSEKVIGHTRDYEKNSRGLSISNPFLIKDDERFRLYYSCALTYIKDCGFCEPKYISFAESDRIDGGYVSAEKPIISPDKNSRFLNLCSGCMKVYKVKDGYVAFQNGIYEENSKSKSSIIMLSSKDGKSFKFEKVILQPQSDSGKTWMNQFVYASHLVKYKDELRLYFNARDTANPLKGKECIGLCTAKL